MLHSNREIVRGMSSQDGEAEAVKQFPWAISSASSFFFVVSFFVLGTVNKIKIEENVSLKPYNTFGIDVSAKYLCHIATPEQLIELMAGDLYRNEAKYILGGGSNTLFTKYFDGLIIRVDLKGYRITEESENHVNVEVNAGENWHGFVMKAVRNNWGGVENLSLIPGTMGAAPMQNIGAYGAEIQNLVEKVDGIDVETGSSRAFSNSQCEFGYRESVFKRGLNKKIFISSVTLRLTKKNHAMNTSYGAIRETLETMKVTEPTIQSISEAVIKIRRSKLPDPEEVGNAGSFFKNPTIDVDQFNELRKINSTMPSYPIDNQNIKIPAAWLIEQCGWKGKTINNIGVHPKQALVLVNYGGGNGHEVLALSEKIQASVFEKFQIMLTPEVNIL